MEACCDCNKLFDIDDLDGHFRCPECAEQDYAHMKNLVARRCEDEKDFNEMMDVVARKCM